jgi:hypothetical protein
MRRSIPVAVVVALALSSGCEVYDATTVAPVVHFTVTVDDAEQSQQIGRFFPGHGLVFLDLDLTLANDGEERAVPAAADHFTLFTAGGYPATPVRQTDLLASTCPAEKAVALGEKISCRIVYAIPWGDPPDHLVYWESEERYLSAAVASPKLLPDPCVDWKNAASEDCKVCLPYTARLGVCTGLLDALDAACKDSLSCIGNFATCAVAQKGCQTTHDCAYAISVYDDCLLGNCNDYCK